MKCKDCRWYVMGDDVVGMYCIGSPEDEIGNDIYDPSKIVTHEFGQNYCPDKDDECVSLFGGDER